MNKFKKILLSVLVACFAVCLSFGIAACTKNSDYPDFKNNGVGEAYKDRYVVSVTSAGGLPLNDVRVTAMKNGSARMSGISVEGKIEFTLPADEYDLVVDEASLPLGYFVDDTVKAKTSIENAKVTIAIPSTVISSTATSSMRYKRGDIMYNFGFTDTSGVKHTLADVLKTKKAVMLNFWYTTCVPCKSEFPAIQGAYEAFSDRISIIALSASDSMDGENGIIRFREQLGLTFYMGQDQAGLTNLFGVSAFPTTVIVDRYGVVAHIESSSKPNESYWKSLFATYTSDDYSQDGNDDNTGDQMEFAKPDSFAQPTTEEYLEAIGGEGAQGKVTNFRPTTSELDKPYSFPWLIGENEDGKYIYASNSKIHYSFATLVFDVALENGEVLLMDYFTSTKETDVLYITVNNQDHLQTSGTGEGWKTDYTYIASRKVKLTIVLLYYKDLKDNDDLDLACVKNIRVANVKDLNLGSDQQSAVTDGLTLSSNNKYPVKLIKPSGIGDDIYYKYEFEHNGEKKTALLLADILNPTVWSDKIFGDTSFYVPDLGRSYKTSLYYVIYWTMSNYKLAGEDIPLEFKLTNSSETNKKLTDEIVLKYYLQEFSDNGLLPVTEGLKEALIAATKAYCQNNNKTYYEDQWLELCFYFVHYGDRHLDNVCSMTNDPVKALAWENADVLGTGKTEINITKIITKDGGGLCYTFTPQTTGIYLFSSTCEKLIDPNIYIYDKDGKNGLTDAIANQDDDVRYDCFVHKDYAYYNFHLYVPLKGGVTYYVRALMGSPGATGKYNLFIERYQNGNELDFLRVASTDYGTWESLKKYNAIPVGLNPLDGYFHEIDANNDYGSTVYIDFVHPNFFDIQDNSLLQLIRNGRFNFKKDDGKDYTLDMLEYYEKSIKGKDRQDELYGLVEADLGLVNLISELVRNTYGDGIESGAWMMFACYYEHIEVPSNWLN